MPFDPLTWAIGFSLSTGGKYIFDQLFSHGLPSKLNDEARVWAEELPVEIRFNYESLFGEIIPDSEIDRFPHLSILRSNLRNKQIPDSETWRNVLTERWEYVRTTLAKEELNAFYSQDQKTAEVHLRQLAKRLELVCKLDSELARVATYDGVQEILGILRAGTISNNRPTSDLMIESLSVQLNLLSSALSKEKASRLEEYRELYRQGFADDAHAKILEMTEDASWNALDKSLRSKVYRVLSSYVLNKKDDAAEAKRLIDYAQQEDPSADLTMLNVLLEYHIHDIDAALEKITEVRDVDTFNLKCALLLEAGRTNEVLLTLRDKPEKIIENAETKRLHALALLLQGKLLEAQAEIERAIYEKPTWKGVRIAAALINYYSQFPNSLLPERLHPWPEPVAYSFLKIDAESINRIRRAEGLFKELTDQETLQKSYFKIWRFACLSNDPGRQTEAQNICAALLTEDPGNPLAIAWAIARNYQFDADLSISVLKNSSLDGKDYMLRILALLDLYLREGRVRESLDVLERAKVQFIQDGAEDAWLIWHARALIEDNQAEEALNNAKTANNREVKIYIKTFALKELSRISGNWELFAEHLDESFKQTGDVQLLYEWCRLKAHLGDWNVVADRAEELISNMHNYLAVDLAAKAAWHANQLAFCLRILNEKAYMFDHGLPPELQRLKVYCQSRLGLIPQALADAEVLFATEASTENLLALMEAQAKKGDLNGLVDSAGKLSNRDDVSCLDLLRAARLIMPQDFYLANKLWHKIPTDSLNDPDCVNQTIEVGFRLGLDKELLPWLQKMHEFSAKGRGTTKMVDLDTLLAMIQENRKRTKFLSEKYEAGEIPVHLFAESLNIPLVRIYHNIPEENRERPDPVTQAIIFARHGGRMSQKDTPTLNPELRLHLDITALLLSWHLGILDKIEQKFKPLRLSSKMQTALITQRDKMLPAQPARMNGYRRILSFIEKGLLTVASIIPQELGSRLNQLVAAKGLDWVLLIKKAVREGGYLVDFFPLTSKELKSKPIILDKPFREHVINCRSLIKSLRKAGKISQEMYLNILTALGAIGAQKPLGPLPAVGAKIHLPTGIAVELALADALTVVCQQYQVSIDQSTIDETQQSIKSYERSKELVQEIESLLSRVNNGIDNGTYETISLIDGTTAEKINDEDHLHPDLQTATDLFSFIPQPNDAIWIDDRFCNSYSHRDGIPIVGIVEILKLLKATKVITKADYYGLLIQLRASNFRYIPLETDELIYQLKRANVKDGEMLETTELYILRRYLNSCLLDVGRIQIPPVIGGVPNPNGEIAFIHGAMRSVSATWTHFWRDKAMPIETVEAYADWILINLYFGVFSARHLRKNDDPENDALDLMGLDIGALFTQGIHFDRNSQRDRRRNYFAWLEQRIVRGRFRANPEALVATERTLQHLISSMINVPQKDKSQEIAAKIILHEFYLDLPETIRNELTLDKEMQKWLGINTIESLRVGELWFAASDFWLASKQAMAGRLATIAPLQSDKKVAIEYVQKNGKSLLRVKSDSPLVEYMMEDQIIRILSDDPDERRAAILSKRIWLDCDNVQIERIVADIVSTEDYVARIRKVNDWRNSSVAFFYERLALNLTEKGRFKFEDLLPQDLEGFLRYFRFEVPWIGGRPFHEVVKRSAEILVVEEGLREALSRLSCLPIFLPQTIITNFAELSIEKRKTFLEEFYNNWASPIAKLQLIKLAFHCSEDTEFLASFIKKTTDSLYDNAEGLYCFKMFKAILLWVNNEFSYSAGSKEWPAEIKLSIIWAHASMLQNIFRISGAPQDEMAIIFETRDHLLGSEILDRNLLFWSDVLHPLRVSRSKLIIHGLLKLLYEEGRQFADQIDIIAVIKNYISRDSEEGELPEFYIFNDPALLRDSTESMFGGDRGAYADILGPEIAQQISSLNLKAIVKKAIDALIIDNCQPQEWLKIFAIVGDLPLYEDLNRQFDSLLDRKSVV